MRNFRLDDESGHQEALFEWAAYHMDCMPELEYMHHIPNGGKRDKRTAVALKRQGVKAGVPDICLPVARNGYHGLYIELKAGKNKATKNQEKWQVFLNDQGYYAVICYGWREATKKVNYDLSKVGLCNTDCSEFQNVCAVASGAAGVTHGSNGWTTATMRNALKAAGYKIITDSAFLKNENYCVRGAIYVKESSHTVCGLTNGTYAAQTLAKAGIGGYAGNNNYSGKGIGTAVAKCDMNIRSVAEVKSNTVYSSIKAGTKVEVLEVLANGWYKIVWAGASCGYAYTSNTNNKYYTYTANSKNNSTSGSSGLKQTQKPESALCFDKTLAGAYVVTADKLHMRAGAGKTKADYGTIAEGGKVHCYGYYNKEKGTGAKWLYVACGNVTGYCHSDYLKRA